MRSYSRQSRRIGDVAATVQGFTRQGYWPRRVEGTLSIAEKKTVMPARLPFASGARVVSAVGVALAYFVDARLSLDLLE